MYKILSGLKVIFSLGFQVLDSSNLTIQSIELEDGTSLKFNLGEVVPNYGSKLTISVPDSTTSGLK